MFSTVLSVSSHGADEDLEGTYKNEPGGESLHDGSSFKCLFFRLLCFSPVDCRLVDVAQQALITLLVGRVGSGWRSKWCWWDLNISEVLVQQLNE
jgi:hypothetical protein